MNANSNMYNALMVAQFFEPNKETMINNAKRNADRRENIPLLIEL